jgi:hypothetical protein
MTTTYLKQVGGAYTEAKTVSTSAGAGDADKVPSLGAAGILDKTIVNAKTSSAGAGDSGVLPALDATGRLDPSFLPVGVTPEVISCTASEALSAGNYVSLYSNAGTLNCRKADASNGRPADGFVLASVSNGGTASVYVEGINTQLTSRTIGATQYLSDVTPGAAIETAPSTSGHIIQVLGRAYGATAATFEPGQPITLA